MASPPRINHNTLEVRHPDLVLYDSFKEAIHAQPIPLSSAEEVKATQNAQEQSSYQVSKGRHRRCGLQPKWFWVILVLAVIAIAIIVGPVVVTIVNRNQRNNKQNVSSGSTGQLVPTNSSHPASIIPTNSSYPASIMKMNENSALASIAWNDVDNNL